MSMKKVPTFLSPNSSRKYVHGIAISPKAIPEEAFIVGTREAVEKIIGGKAAMIPLDENNAVICNRECRLRSVSRDGEYIAGDFLIVGNAAGMLADMSPLDIDSWLLRLNNPGEVVTLDGEKLGSIIGPKAGEEASKIKAKYRVIAEKII